MSATRVARAQCVPARHAQRSSRRPQPPTTTAPPAEPAVPLATIMVQPAAGGLAFSGRDVARLLDLADYSPGFDSRSRVEQLVNAEDALTLLAGAASILERLGRSDDPAPLSSEASRVLEFVVSHARARLRAAVTWPATADATPYLVTVPPAEPAASQEVR